MIFNKGSLIGLDIQPNAIHLVQLNEHQQLQNRLTSIPKWTYFQDGKIQDWQALTRSLQEMLQQLNLKTKNAAISLPAAQVHVCNIEMATSFSDEELDYEIDKYVAAELPWMKEVLCKDYHVKRLHHNDRCLVTVVISRQAYIEQFNDCLRQAQLRLRVVDVDIYALNRLLGHMLGLTFRHQHYLILYVNTHALLIEHKHQQLNLLQQWEINNESNFIDYASQVVRQARLQADKPTALILCGTSKYLGCLSDNIYTELGLEIYRPQLPIEDQYWLAFSLALRKAV